MAKLKVRNQFTNLPYSIKINPLGSDVILHSAGGLYDAEYEVPDNISNTLTGFKITATDSQGATLVQELDGVTYNALKKFYFGPSVADGNPDNHIQAIDQAVANNCTYVGVIFERNDIQNDAAFNALDSIVFDHTVDAPGGVYAKQYDRVVRYAKKMNMPIKVGVHLALENVNLNNGSDRTVFYGQNALNKRANGENTYKEEPGPVPSRMIPSYASTEFRSYARRYLTKLFKRYLNAINDGTILSIGMIMATSGESEYVTGERESDGSKNNPSRGDFHPEMISKFKAKFPVYANTSNNDISNADQTNTDLGKRWTWHLADQMRECEWYVIDSVIADVSGLTRRKWFHIDCGSFLDGLAPRRRTFNLWARIHPANIMVKSNDNNHYSTDFMKLIAAFLSSCNRKYGGIAIIEISPQSGRYDEASGERPGILATMNINTSFAIGESFYNREEPNVDWMISAGALATVGIPKYVNEFKTVSGRKVLNRLVYNLSNMYAIQSSSGLLAAYNNYLSTNGLDKADILVVDDIKPQNT